MMHTLTRAEWILKEQCKAAAVFTSQSAVSIHFYYFGSEMKGRRVPGAFRWLLENNSHSLHLRTSVWILLVAKDISCPYISWEWECIDIYGHDGPRVSLELLWGRLKYDFEDPFTSMNPILMTGYSDISAVKASIHNEYHNNCQKFYICLDL